MATVTLVIETFLTTCNSGVQSSRSFGGSSKVYGLEELCAQRKRDPSICFHYPENILCGPISIIHVENRGHPLNSLSSERQPTNAPNHLLRPHQESPKA